MLAVDVNINIPWYSYLYAIGIAYEVNIHPLPPKWSF